MNSGLTILTIDRSIHENVLEDVVPRIRDYTDSTKETF